MFIYSGWPGNKDNCTFLFNLCIDVVEGKVPKEKFTVELVSIRVE